MNLSICAVIIALSFCDHATARVRRVEAAPDQITTVRTALGIATIVQVPDQPNSIVVGDQASFKVEYLDQAITIKPLRGAAKTNLYIYTDYRRYNVQLVAGQEGIADYIVYLDNPKPKPLKANVHWLTVGRSITNEGTVLSVSRMARTKEGVLLIDFKLGGQGKLDPKWLWITQGGATRPIQNLFLSRLEATITDPATGTLELFERDLDRYVPIRIELRKKKAVFLLLPRAAAWK